MSFLVLFDENDLHRNWFIISVSCLNWGGYWRGLTSSYGVSAMIVHKVECMPVWVLSDKCLDSLLNDIFTGTPDLHKVVSVRVWCSLGHTHYILQLAVLWWAGIRSDKKKSNSAFLEITVFLECLEKYKTQMSVFFSPPVHFARRMSHVQITRWAHCQCQVAFFLVWTISSHRRTRRP